MSPSALLAPLGFGGDAGASWCQLPTCDNSCLHLHLQVCSALYVLSNPVNLTGSRVVLNPGRPGRGAMGDTRGRVPGSSSAHTLLQLCWEPLAHFGRRGVLLGLCPGNSSKAAVIGHRKPKHIPSFFHLCSWGSRSPHLPEYAASASSRFWCDPSSWSPSAFSGEAAWTVSEMAAWPVAQMPRMKERADHTRRARLRGGGWELTGQNSVRRRAE